MTECNAWPRVVRGDEALALGAWAAGVRVVTGYPGAPTTRVFDQLLALSNPAQTQVEWAPNEKVAFELAFGASLGGARSLVVLKSVGLNIALDPLATMALSGCHAGLVVLLGDDPGGWSSQNEQDTRWAARIAEVPVVEPTGVEAAAALMTQAFAWSEALGTPVILRMTGALAEARASINAPWQLPPANKRFLRKRNRWVVLPALVVRRHRSLHNRLRVVQQMFEASPYDVTHGQGGLGIVAVGYTHAKLHQLLGEQVERYRLLALTSVWPLPARSLLRWLRGAEKVLVLEEGSGFVEQGLRDLAQQAGLNLPILGRADHVVPEEGELSLPDLSRALARLDPAYHPPALAASVHSMPSNTPLCDDCPYRPAFNALLGAMERHGGRAQYLVTGETGCMVRANLPPFELFDVKYSLGSSLGLGVGLALSGVEQHVVALLGDSSFFHSEMNVAPHLAQLQCPLTVVVLDNGSAALTGGQVHPGSRRDERGRPRRGVSLEDVLAGCGLAPQTHTLADLPALEAALDEALATRALRVLVVHGPCPRYEGNPDSS